MRSQGVCSRGPFRRVGARSDTLLSREGMPVDYPVEFRVVETGALKIRAIAERARKVGSGTSQAKSAYLV